jgi:hypothetical protein
MFSCARVIAAFLTVAAGAKYPAGSRSATYGPLFLLMFDPILLFAERSAVMFGPGEPWHGVSPDCPRVVIASGLYYPAVTS